MIKKDGRISYRKTDPNLTEEQKEIARAKAREAALADMRINTKKEKDFFRDNGVDEKIRTCNKCGDKFKSVSNANRRCPQCKLVCENYHEWI